MVDIQTEATFESKYNLSAIYQFCNAAAKACGVNDEEQVSVVFTNNEEIAKLNASYRNKDEPTDVLSFAFNETEAWPDPEGNNVLGEVFISTQMLSTNAVYFDVDEDEELKRLIIHGFLHLLGYDHETNSEAEPMLQKQEKILTQFVSFLLKSEGKG